MFMQYHSRAEKNGRALSARSLGSASTGSALRQREESGERREGEEGGGNGIGVNSCENVIHYKEWKVEKHINHMIYISAC